MGREVKRVPVDFDWPYKHVRGKSNVWKGYINPYYVHCHDCPKCGSTNGRGYSPEANAFHDLWYGYAEFDPVAHGSKLYTPDEPCIREHALRNVSRDPVFYCQWDNEPRNYKSITSRPAHHGHYGLTLEGGIQREAVRLCELFNTKWSYHLNEIDIAALVAEDDYEIKQWREAHEGRIPTPDEMRAISIFSFRGSTPGYICIKARCEREGVPLLCDVCNGDGQQWDSPELEKKADDWEREEPPTGPAYQIWETVSEGSPVSPPFLDPRELAEWMVANDDSITADTDVEGWVKFITGPGWAPSAMGIEGQGLVSGVKAVVENDNA